LLFRPGNTVHRHGLIGRVAPDRTGHTFSFHLCFESGVENISG
jgi:hypothetical protein